LWAILTTSIIYGYVYVIVELLKTDIVKSYFGDFIHKSRARNNRYIACRDNNEVICFVAATRRGHCISPMTNNVVIAAYTMALARLKLYRYLKLLDTQVLPYRFVHICKRTEQIRIVYRKLSGRYDERTQKLWSWYLISSHLCQEARHFTRMSFVRQKDARTKFVR